MKSLVYASGLGDDETAWQLLRSEPLLADVDHHAYPIPGTNNRPWNGESTEEIADDLAEFIARFNESVVLVGHSFGGVLGVLLAESAATNYGGFINIEGNLTLAECTISSYAAQAEDFDAWFEDFMPTIPVRYRNALQRCDRTAFRSLAKDLVRLSDGMGQRYQAIDVPKLLIYGTDGYAVSTQQWVVTNDLDAVCVEGAGHWVHEDAPEQTAEAIKNFLYK